jgi:amino acid adenylation domain-containing protein/non-ribosomal peptide synthase protein (TIGR01720 family)
MTITAAIDVAPERQLRLLEAVQNLFAGLLGASADEIASRATFLELGADSLLLLRAGQALHDRFGVKVPFRRLLEDLATPDDLAAHLARVLPADDERAAAGPPLDSTAAPSRAQQPVTCSPASSPASANLDPAPAVPAEATPTSQAIADSVAKLAKSPAANARGDVARVIADQLRLMSKQLEVLGAAQHRATRQERAGSAVAAQGVVTAATVPAPSSQAPAADGAAATRKRQPFVPFAPLDRSRDRSLTPAQRAHLDDLIERVTRRTRRSKDLAQEFRGVLANNRASAGFRLLWKELVYPLAGHRGKGSRIWDVDGHQYIDLTMGFGALLYGHSPDFMQEALARQLGLGIQIGPESEHAGEAAALLCELTGAERATFCNSGTEAVMVALRLARTVTGRSRIALFAGSYHGTFDGVLAKGTRAADGSYSVVPMAPGIPASLIQDVVLLDYESLDSLDVVKQMGSDLAAVLVEPRQSRRPDLDRREFLQRLREITSDAGTALIFDEVVTGFRVHPGGIQAVYGVRADITTYGKAVANGLPIGVVAGKAKYLDAIDGGGWRYGDSSLPEVDTTFFAGTFFRHPLVMAGVLASLRHIKERGPRLQEELNARTAAMASKLNAFFSAEGMPLSVAHFGSLFLVTAPPDRRFMDLFYAHLLLRGVYVWERRVCYLSTAHSDDDIRLVIEAFQESALELRRAGFLPGATHGEASGARTEAPAPAALPVRTAAAAAPAEATAAQIEPETYPLTEAQRELWSLAQLGDEASVAYNLSMRVRLNGALHDDQLIRALHAVVDRHDALRGSIDPLGDTQTVVRNARLPVQHSDLSALDPVDRERRLDAISDSEARRPFDLACAPLLRAHLVKLEREAHVLLITAHHIAADGQSLGVVLDEVARLYSAAAQNERVDLPPATQFRAYVDELARREASGGMAEAERFWLDHLRAPLPPLELPLDRPRPPIQTYAGDRRLMSLGPADADRVRALAQRLGCTPLMVLLSAVKVLLRRLSNRDQIVVAVPAAGQPLVGADVVGHCVNVLPLATRLTGHMRFSEVAAAVKGALLDGYEHRAYPFSRMVKQVEGARRDPSRPPLAAVMCNLDHGSRLTLPGLEVDITANPNRAAQFELEWNVVENEGGLEVECFYNTDLFDATTIDRWQSSLRRLLIGASRDPDQPLDDMDLVGDDERECLLEGWNHGARPVVADRCLHEIVDEQAARSPSAVAVAFDGREMTYDELRRRSDALGRVLAAQGVGPEEVVALLAERSDIFLVAMLAIFKAGAAYLPLDPRQPAARHRQVLTGSRAAWLLASASAAAPAREALIGLDTQPRPTLLSLDDCLITPARENIALAKVDPAQLAYVIYTSGSTGVPKGAMLVHSGMLNHLRAKVIDLALTGRDRVAQTATQSFDISVWQFLAALMAGGRVQIYGDHLAHAPTALFERVETDAVSVLELVPSQLRAMLDETGDSPAPPLSRLRCLLLTGEALPPDVCRRWLARYPSVPIVNAYGPTECSDDVTHGFVFEAPAAGATRVPIGRPVANTRVYVLNERLQPQPIGVPGEVYIAGAGVGRGYRHDPAQTAAGFLPDPFATEPGRMYRTGDLVRWRPDGSLEYLRRIDDQVKVRGFRIEPAEIEAALRQCPGVRDAAVTVRDDSGQPQLVAYVVAQAGSIASAALRERLLEGLPRYMVPAHFVKIDAIPLSPNGKIDVKLLPAPAPAVGDPLRVHVAPGTPEEAALAAIWSDVLKVEAPSVHDNFFDLGGDSIQAIQIVARARREGLSLTPIDIFEHETLAELAAAARRSRRTAESGGSEPSAPLTPVQHWFFEQPLTRPNQWNMSARFDVHEPIDRRSLTEAVRAVVAHHDALRARFPRGEARAVFSPVDEAVGEVEWIDLSALSEDQRAAAFERCAAEMQASLDVASGPLTRIAYFDAGPGTPGRLLWVAHHLAVDIVSWRVLAEDLTAAYRASVRGEPARLAPVSSFAQWSQRLAEFAGSTAVAGEADSWLARVTGAAPLPEDSPRGGNTQASVRVVSESLGPGDTATLVRDVPRRLRARVSEVLAAALQTAFERWTGQNDLLIDIEGHGREPLFDDIDIARTVGWFTALFPVRLSAEPDADVADRLRAVKEALRAAPHGGLGYGLLRYLRTGATGQVLARAPEAQVVLNYRGETGGHADDLLFQRVAGPIGPNMHPDNARRYLLEIDAAVVRGRFELHIAYSRARHRRATIQSLVDGILSALRELLAACRDPEAVALSPADFPKARVSERDLGRLLGRLAGAARR